MMYNVFVGALNLTLLLLLLCLKLLSEFLISTDSAATIKFRLKSNFSNIHFSNNLRELCGILRVFVLPGQPGSL